MRAKLLRFPPTAFMFLLSLTVAAPAAAATVKLPVPSLTGRSSVEASLQARRSTRSFESVPMSLADFGELLWAAQGVTTPEGKRTAPSAGATYPLEVYAVALDVRDLEPGVYHYRPKTHEIERVAAGNRRAQIVEAARGQQSIAQAPVVFVISAAIGRTAAKYGARAERYAWIEAGAAAENLALEAVALNLGTCFVGAFDEAAIRGVVGLTATESPIIVLPAGRPRR
jgi:SagB-type dehydrogenase family enzyme